MLKKIILLGFVILISILLPAQEITGTWQSEDGTRVYQITENEQHIRVILINSSRSSDETGKIIIQQLNKKRNKYKGIIHSHDDNLSTSVVVKHISKGKEILRLKLKRMLFFDIKIRWHRFPSVN
ncbi:MAG: hypothetical protein JNK27_13720 [Chitinophagaceae bacterium]|nr:hypothetical protein [Chitinophagaceae bacterium]